MKRFYISVIGIAILVTSIASAHLHPFGNPRSTPARERTAVLSGTPMPDAAKRILTAKCADCHSNATRWPAYSNAAPISWLVEHDVIEGRARLNLSRWPEFSPDRQEALAQEIVQQAKHGTMPPLPYRLFHWHGRLSSAEIAALATLAPDAIEEAPTGPGDPLRGKSVFERRCTGCHALNSNREGPHLRGVYGRKAGSVPDFEYSAAIKASGVIWNDTNLERWLRGTDEFIAGNNMGFSVPKAQDRTDIIAFLRAVR
jgi:cytochrome c